MGDHRAGQPNHITRIAGPGASAIKYDILTALLVTAAQGSPVEARLALRLSLLITARFNWRQGSFAIGQREIARMWGVTERTAKRELAEMRGRGWITIAVPAARGRVAQYRIEFPVILRTTMPHWQAVGPDFAARMAGAPEPAEEPSNVVPLRRDATALPEDDGSGWAQAAALLRDQDPAVYSAWLAPLVPLDCESGILTLRAPTRFHADYVRTHHLTRIHAALASENRAIRDVVIEGDLR
ncbi:MAG: DnaA N-terminal domain-containing protein [Maritimibacter sp.]